MSENSLWIVPTNQDACVSDVWEIAEQLWELGFIPTLDLTESLCLGGPVGYEERSYDYFHKRAKRWLASGRTLPKGYQGEFETILITCLPKKNLVPATAGQFCDLHCPRCHRKFVPSINSTLDAPFGRSIETGVRCYGCDNIFPAAEIEFNPSEMTWARFSISFHNISSPEAPLDEPWVNDVIAVVGSSSQFHGWES